MEVLTLFPYLARAGLLVRTASGRRVCVTLLVRRREELRIWTEDAVTMLKERWAAGDSATEIAKAINWRLKLSPELSRSAVLGKIGRLGLQRAQYDQTGAPVLRKQSSLAESFDPDGCRFLTGDPLDPGARYCGAKPVLPRVNRKGEKLPGSWCAEHHKVVFQSAAARKRASTFVMRKKPGALSMRGTPSRI